MTVWIVSLEWNHPSSEVTGDTGIVGVYHSKAEATAAHLAEQRERHDDGDLVPNFSMIAGRYCAVCGEEGCTVSHDPLADVAFCDHCGAELTAHDTCDNDHDEWTVDVHLTEHTVQGQAVAA